MDMFGPDGLHHDSVAIPDAPSPSRPHAFPVVATVAPVVVSLVMWAVTQSMFALMFAALGPVVAISGLVDARIQNSRRSKRELARCDRAASVAAEQIQAAHEREREELRLRFPSARSALAQSRASGERWRATVDRPIAVRIGRGAMTSTLELTGGREPAPGHDEVPGARLVAAQLDGLRSLAGRLEDAPVVVDARLGIGVFGSPAGTLAVARGFGIQLAAQLHPVRHEVVGGSDTLGERWLARLPHGSGRDGDRGGGGRAFVIRFVDRSSPDAPEIEIAVAERREDLPGTVRVLVAVGGPGGSRIEHHPDRSAIGPVSLEHVSSEQAAIWADALAEQARRDGLVTAETRLPHQLGFGELAAERRAESRNASTLVAAIAVGAAGAFSVDLVNDGPHAIIGGTTGSGKSELLIAWVLALASRYSPENLTVLLVDFKGGAAFSGLSTLPHSVGLITDLDEVAAERALQSLSAELRYRERTIAAHGARSIDELPPEAGLARLVVVVDEFAAMANGFPELSALFSDVAARGRSLGVHLILCTQRPAGVIREAVLANSGLRISLRVNNRADSTAVIGTPGAASIPAKDRGSALVATPDSGEPIAVQFPLVSPEDIAEVCETWGKAIAPRRPWCDPLPSMIARNALAANTAPAANTDSTGFAFGRSDIPELQCQPDALYSPQEHGNLLVIGGTRSGKSTLLNTIMASCGRSTAVAVPTAAGKAWDAVEQLVGTMRSSGNSDASASAGDQPVASRVVVIDDFDVIVARLPDEYAAAFVENVAQLLREGPRAALYVVIATQRMTAALHGVAALCSSRLILGMPNRHEHALAGGMSEQFRERTCPGRGHWLGHPVQVAVSEPVPERPGSEVIAVVDVRQACAVVSTRPHQIAERIRLAIAPGAQAAPAVLDCAVVELSAHGSFDELTFANGDRASVVVGDPESWLSHWGAITSLSRTMPILFDRCSVAEFRGATRSRSLPPPLIDEADALWQLMPDGAVRRVLLP